MNPERIGPKRLCRKRPGKIDLYNIFILIHERTIVENTIVKNGVLNVTKSVRKKWYDEKVEQYMYFLGYYLLSVPLCLLLCRFISE